MKRFIAPLLIAIAVTFGSTGYSEARDHGYRSHSSHNHGHSRSHRNRSHSSGHCQPRHHHSYHHQPRYYTPRYYTPRYYAPPRHHYYAPDPCYRRGGIAISTPGFGFFFRH